MHETSYIYRGPSKIYERPTTKKDKTNCVFDKMCFVIVGSYPVNNTKSKGNRLLQKYKGSEIFEYQLDLAYETCSNPEVILITGLQQKEFLKHPRRNECSIIENPFFEFTNSAEDIRLALMACRSNDVIFLDGAIIPTYEIMKSVLTCKRSKAFYRKNDGYDQAGLVTSSGIEVITSYSYSSNKKLTGMYYLNKGDMDRLRKKTIGCGFSKNKFFYELLNELKILPVEDNSTIIC